MASSSSLPGLLWARVPFFWLAFFLALPQVPLTAQSTSNGPGPSESRPSVELSLSKVSSELVTTLRDLTEKYPKAIEESESLREQVKSLSGQVSELSSSSESWEADSKRLTGLVKSLTTQFEDYQKASEAKAEIDAQAIDEARADRDEARSILPWAGVGGAIIGALTALGINAILSFIGGL